MGKFKDRLLLVFAVFLICGIYVALMTFEGSTPIDDPMASYPTRENGTGIVKRILLWTPWYGHEKWGLMKDRNMTVLDYCSHPCTLHDDRSNPLMYDALVFHGPDIQSPPKRRNPNQVYIIFIHECPYYGGDNYIQGDHFYNWSATYHPKSDIWIPYAKFGKRKNEAMEDLLPEILKGLQNTHNQPFVLWVVGNCQTPGRRKEYVHKLQKYIEVDTYGNCGKPCPEKETRYGRECLLSLAATGKYKFYLAFENTACECYITEKAQRPLLAGLVPVVYGGFERVEYENTLPPNSFIDVRDFTSPEQLAKHLLYLSTNEEAYMAYHAWRTDYILWPGDFEDMLADGICGMCRALHSSSMMAPRNVNWGKFWSRSTKCDIHFIDKVATSPKRILISRPHEIPIYSVDY